MTRGLATVFGGSGFLGRYVVRRLVRDGWQVRVAVRRPDEALFLKTAGNIGQVTPLSANIRDDRSVQIAVSGAELVVNLVGILFQAGRQRFDAVHTAGAARVAAAAAAAGAQKLIHISALGADAHSPSAYAKSKAAGEDAVRKAFPAATILRPSIVFGPEDEFFNRFAKMALVSPVLPLIGGGATRFQPVYVLDVAEAVARCAANPEFAAKTFELGGPRIYSFRELMTLLLAELGRRRLLVSLPFALAGLQGALLQSVPFIRPPLTADQVRQLKRDNIVGAQSAGFKELGLTPTAVEPILPTYLDLYRPHGFYSRARSG